MKINYRPADAESELRPLAETFLRHYELKKPSEIRVEPSIDGLTPGVMICPERGSVIEEICRRNTSNHPGLVRAGKSYVVIDIAPGQRCLVEFEYRKPWTKE